MNSQSPMQAPIEDSSTVVRERPLSDRNPAVSAIIVSWNTRQLTLDCVESLASTQAALSTEIIVVDNASSDDTVDQLRSKYPHVKVIANQENLGFARANNLGMAACTGPYVALINSDVVVPPGCLENIVQYMDHHPDIGMLGPKMILRDGSIGPSVYKFPTVWNWFCNALGLSLAFKGSGAFANFELPNFDYNKTQDVDVLTGWFWVVRSSALPKVGVLDDRFFMYGEDLDWPRRFQKAGWRVTYYSDAQAIHYCGASSDRAPARFYVEMNRANLQYFRKHHNFLAVFGFWLAMTLQQLVRVTGYSVVYLFRAGNRTTVACKIKRSAACLLWLLGLKRASEVR
jgi:GT2 family glycosyltransferase